MLYWKRRSLILRAIKFSVHLHVIYPGPRGFLLILSFLLGNLRREALIEASSREKRKPLESDQDRLTFMLAQLLTAVKDVIFFRPITSPKIFNQSNRMTRSAIKNIFQSETTVKS